MTLHAADISACGMAPGDLRGHVRLWSAVLVHGISDVVRDWLEDAIQQNDDGAPWPDAAAGAWQRQAVWLHGRRFDLACFLLGLDPDAVRDHIRAAGQSRQQLSACHRRFTGPRKRVARVIVR